MNYDENRISDQIDGGLKNQEESIQIDYAIYGKIIDKNPLIRYKTLAEAKDAYSVTENVMIVCEVSNVQKDGSLLIKQERIIKAPQIWLPAERFIPEFDDDYLCHLVRKEECGNFIKWQEVIRFEKLQWQKRSDTRVTHWMIVENPNVKNNYYERYFI